jgi:transient receptor potential cation channel subfamily C
LPIENLPSKSDFSNSFSLHLFSLWETSQTLFWAAFGLIDLDNFELTGIKEFTRFWALIMFGSFSVINIIVLLNLLIAMMNHSYQLISVSSVSADVYWKAFSIAIKRGN